MVLCLELNILGGLHLRAATCVVKHDEQQHDFDRLPDQYTTSISWTPHAANTYHRYYRRYSDHAST